MTAAYPQPAPMPLASFAAARPCAACSHESYAVAVFTTHRLIHHADRRVPPCRVANPVQEGQS